MSTETDGTAGDAHSHGGARHSHAHGHTAHAHDFAVPELPESVDIFDTILRDGSQQEGLSLTVDDKLRVAEQLDHLGVTFIEGGWPGANPKDVEFFARAKKELTLAQRHAGGVRVHPSGRRETGNRRCPGQPGRGRSAGRLHRRQVVGPPRRRGPAHLPRRGGRHGGRLRALPARARPARLPRRGALLRRLPTQPRLRAVRPGGGGGSGRRGAGAVRHQRRLAAGRRGPGRRRCAGAHERTTRHPLPQRRRLRGGQLVGGGAGRRHPGAGVHQRLRRAGGQHRPVGGHPQPLAQDAHPHHPGRPAGAAHPGGAPHRRAGQHRTQPPTALRREFGLRAQGRLARQCRGAQRRPLRARRAQPGRERDPGRRVGDGRPVDAVHEGGRARAPARRRGHRPGARRAQAPGARGIPLRGGRRLTGAPVAAGDRLGQPTTSRWSRSASSPITTSATRPKAPRPQAPTFPGS